MQLIALPYAGGAARVFQAWQPYLRRGLTLHPRDRAGQGGRIDEPPGESFAATVDDLAECIAELAEDGPYAVYGHSMGGLLAYEALRRVAGWGVPAARALMVGGCRPPQLGRAGPVLHTLPDREFLAALSGLGGVPQELLDLTEAVDYYAPLVRADYRLFESYEFNPRATRLACPILAFVGDADPVTTPAEAPRWAELTTGPVRCHTLAGAGHFTVVERAAEIVGWLNSALSPTSIGGVHA